MCRPCVRVLALALGCALGGIAHAEPIEVYIMAGQSNMVGGGGLAEIPEALVQPQDDIDYWWWTPTRDPAIWDGWGVMQHSPPSSGSSYSAELSFGRRMSDHGDGRRVAIIKVAQNGTRLRLDWHPDQVENEHGQRLFATLIDEVGAAMEALVIANPGEQINIAGMVWIQGDGDSRFSYDASHYAQNLGEFIGAIRLELDALQLPFIYSQLHEKSPNEFADTVRVEQSLFAAIDPLAYMLRVDDLAMKPDNIHFSGASRLELGDRFANTMLSIQSLRGDMDGDRGLSAFDIGIFEAALSEGRPWGDAATLPVLGIVGDINRDGNFDAFDVAPFELAISQAVPEPASGLIFCLAVGCAGIARKHGNRYA